MSAFDLVSSFFTPIYLFLFLNLIIGTIFLTSRHRPTKPHPLARSPSSLIDRVRSINLSLHKFDTHPQPDPAQQHYYPGPVHEAADDDGSPPPPPMAGAPSLLAQEPEHEPLQRVDLSSAPLSRAPSLLLDRLRSMNFYYQKFNDQPAYPVGEMDRLGDARDDAAPLARAPSLLGRLSSIKFPSIFGPGPDAEPDDHDANRQGKDSTGPAPVRRIRSESERLGEEGPKPRMRKTASERSAAVEGEEAEEEEINAKADDFIQRFRQQLRLQRLDSIRRYTDMLTGGR